MQPSQNDTCPLCGKANQCSLAAGANTTPDCWCFAVTITPEALAQIPADQLNKACLCPNCAAQLPVNALADEHQ